MSNTPLNADEQQYRFAHNPLAHQLFHTFRAMVTKKGVDAALADIAEAQAADRKKHELQARTDELEHTFVSYDNALASELVENPEWEYGQVVERIAELKQELESYEYNSN